MEQTTDKFILLIYFATSLKETFIFIDWPFINSLFLGVCVLQKEKKIQKVCFSIKQDVPSFQMPSAA